MSALLSFPEEEWPTAIIAYNDIMAFGALHALRTQGLHVPNNMSVVGCDGLLMAAHCNPPLTTIDQPKYTMGRLAMQTLRQMLNHQHSLWEDIHYWRVLSSSASRVAHARTSKNDTHAVIGVLLLKKAGTTR